MLPLGASTYLITRRAAVTYVNGLPVRTAPTTFNVVASVQPLNGQDLIRAPEGLRRSDARKAYLYITDEVRTVLAAGVEADLMTVNGVVYEIYHIDPHNVFSPLPHQRAYLQAAQGTDGAQVGS